MLAFWLLLLTVAGEIFMPQLMLVLAPGFMDIPGKAELTVALARITFPYVLLICLAALLSGVLNGLDRFAAAAAAPLVFNTVSIAAMLLLTPLAADGRARARLGRHHLRRAAARAPGLGGPPRRHGAAHPPPAPDAADARAAGRAWGPACSAPA